MTLSAEMIAYRSRSSLRLVAWSSIAYLVYAVFQLYSQVTILLDRLHHADAGVKLGFDPQLQVREPTGTTFSGGSYVVPGTMMTIDHATATVAHVPSSSIPLQSASDLVGVLTGAGIALCVLLLVRRVIQGQPFARTAVRVLIALAVVVMVGLEAQSVLRFIAGQQVLAVLYSKPEEGYGTGETSATIISYLPLYIGAALLGLAAVFRVGAQLQRETDGLV